jgi:hypothetical protein
MDGLSLEKVKRELTRREFTAASINALFVGMGVTLVACGGGGGGGYVTGPSATSGPTPASSPTATTSGDKTGAISGNHGHVAVVLAAQLQSGGKVSLDIRGTADHTHSLDLTADQVRQVAASARVSVTTSAFGMGGDYGSSGDHDHTVTFN